ncbi:uncharacterized protein LOC132081419 [Ammospiza nelsoni]|uniref:uncharacterized protein LOC132081419 n=1 Tax=Ammospiza nelsoni TaxID=2857394 RepID=UPI002869B46D|nr:uncharacterized protein LOC132081419 [Ammospiza nelsoni]
MLRSGPGAGLVLAAAAALCLGGAGAKVYYSCGAVVESMERGLILSPGFPNNYYPGTHCVWQFFIPMRTHLILEIFDFDIFESSSETPAPWDGFSAPATTENKDMPSLEENLGFAVHTTKASLQSSMSKGAQNLSSTGDQSKDLAGHLDELPGTISKKNEAKQASEENQWKQMKEPKAMTKAQPEELPLPVAGSASMQRQNTSGLETEGDVEGKVLLAHLAAGERDEVTAESWTLPSTALPMEISSPQPAGDICPHDVLYVSDLITFSSRFCGPNSPVNKTMVFGSSLEMVEVIMELITTTDRGRGFAMLFEYRNISEPGPVGAVRQDRRENMMLLAVVTGIVVFALALLSALCVACRPRTCPKRSSSNACSDQENRIQNSTVDINELQLVVPSRENENNNHSVSREQAVTSCRGSTERSPQDTDPDVPSSISAVTTETGSDEVFIISAGPGTSGLSFTTYRIQDKNLKRSVTSPGSVSEWLSSQPAAAGAADKGNAQLENPCPRQRTWSARTFHDLLAPIPQLQKKWCSWSTNSPFTKLVDSSGFSTAARPQGVPTRKVISATEIEGASETVYSDSSASNASYPLTLSAQRQRKLTSCNLKKSRFGNPYFGFLASSPDSKHMRSLDPSRHLGAASPVNSQSPKNLLESSNPLKINLVNGSKTKELMVETDKNKPVFVISEEGDDQQPLVLAEHLSQCGDHLPEQNAVYAQAMPEKQPVVLSAERNSSAPFTSSLPLWAKSPTSYKGHGKGPSSSRDQQSSALSVGGDANSAEPSQNCDAPAAATLCQASAQ